MFTIFETKLLTDLIMSNKEIQAICNTKVKEGLCSNRMEALIAFLQASKDSLQGGRNEV